jgi:DNA-binding PadR family transcriptional regulator
MHHHYGHRQPHDEYAFIGRHRGGHHRLGRFVAAFRDDGLGGDGFRTGRKIGADELQLLILALLAEKPSHGYELIKALDERSGGFYSPSPGMVYPALTYLDETGLTTVTADGAKKRYQITAEGLAHLAENRAHADAILEQLARIGQRMGQVRRAFAGDPSSEDFTDEAQGGPELHRARHELKAALKTALKAALSGRRGLPPGEQRRIAGILRRAAAEILAGGPQQKPTQDDE